MELGITGKVALVTGGSRGLGRQAALTLAREGCQVAICARGIEQLDEVVSELKELSPRSVGFQADVPTAEGSSLFYAGATAAIGPADILVNNVGMRDRRTIDEVEATEFEALLQVNLTAVYALSRSAAAFMRAQHGGRIINMSALASVVGLPHGPSYAASKGGLEALTRMLAVSLGQYGITVNAISPGYFATETNATMQADETLRHKLEGRTSLRRWGQPHEIAGAAVFLASDEASYITGQVLTVDGGCVSHF